MKIEVFSDTSTLVNICSIAAERYRENAETFRKLIDHKPDPDSMMQIHGAQARALAEQFDAQADEARKLCQIFNAAIERFDVRYDEEMVEID